VVVVAHSRAHFRQDHRSATMVAISVLRSDIEWSAPHASQRSGMRRKSRCHDVVSTPMYLQAELLTLFCPDFGRVGAVA
jgi:hypothetical protein